MQTKALALQPVPSTTPFMACSKVFLWEISFVLLTEWLKELYHEFVFKI